MKELSIPNPMLTVKSAEVILDLVLEKFESFGGDDPKAIQDDEYRLALRTLRAVFGSIVKKGIGKVEFFTYLVDGQDDKGNIESWPAGLDGVPRSFDANYHETIRKLPQTPPPEYPSDRIEST